MSNEEKLFCILGRPARHSLSPFFQQAGFDAIKLNATYLAFEPKSLKDAVSCLCKFGVDGFNITMPFKEEIIPLLDRVDVLAKKIGAVNTVVNEKGKLVGYNTDGLGAVNALKKKIKLGNKRVLLLGTGGAAKAIAFALKKEGTKLTIAGRKKSLPKTRKLAKSLNANNAVIEAVDSLVDFDVLINATPVGMAPDKNSPVDTKLLHKKLVVFDIVYKPPKTRLLKAAEKKGCKTVSGVEMLLEQGYLAFRLFTKRRVPKKKMADAAMSKLGGKSD